MIEYRPIDLSPEGIEEICALLHLVHPRATHIDTAYLRRLYFGHPLGETSGYAAWDRGRLVGHYLVQPILCLVDGEEEMGMAPFQLATHHEYRRRGLFREMAERAFRVEREKGRSFLTGIANQQSAPLFVINWGFQIPCQLDARLGFGPVPPPAPDWEPQFARVWSRETLAWRLRLPARAYQLVCDDDRGTLHADTGRLGIQVEMGSFERSMLPDDLPPRRSPHGLRLWIGAGGRRHWLRSLYWSIPMRLRPSGLNLIWGDLTGRNRRLDADRVQVDAIDFDAF